MKNENTVVNRHSFCHLALEGEGGTQCQVRGKEYKDNPMDTPSSALRASSPSWGKRSSSGFTLIELLVVVLIIGILAAVAVPQYQFSVAKASSLEGLLGLKNLQKAEKLYFLANDAYTYELEELDVSLPNQNRYLVQEENKKIQYNGKYIGLSYYPQSDVFYCQADTLSQLAHRLCKNLVGVEVEGFDSPNGFTYYLFP